MNNRSFTKQKFTNLKSPKEVKVESTTSSEEEVFEENLDYDNGLPNNIIDGIESEENEIYEEEGTVEITEIESQLVEEVSKREQLKYRPGNPRNFYELSKHDQGQAIIDFNRIYNGMFTVLTIGVICLVMAIFSYWMLAAALPLIFSGWITSMVAATKLKKRGLIKEKGPLRRKLNFTRFVYFVGVAACAITFFGGVVLLILWLSKVI